MLSCRTWLGEIAAAIPTGQGYVGMEYGIDVPAKSLCEPHASSTTCDLRMGVVIPTRPPAWGVPMAAAVATY